MPGSAKDTLVFQVGLQYTAARDKKTAEIVAWDEKGEKRVAGAEVSACEIDNLVDAPRLATLDRKTIEEIASQLHTVMVATLIPNCRFVPVENVYVEAGKTTDEEGRKTTNEKMVLNLSQSILLSIQRSLCAKLMEK